MSADPSPGGQWPWRPGFAANRTEAANEEGDPSPPPASDGRLKRNLAIIGVVALVAAPLVVRGAPLERGNWIVAAAREKELNGDLPGAIALVDEALESNAVAPWWRVYRSQLELDRNQPQAAAQQMDLVLKDNADYVPALYVRMQALQYLGKHDQAIADAEAIREAYSGRGARAAAESLNTLAYARAIGKRDLDKALEDVNLALEILGENPAMLDTRAVVYHGLGKHRLALADMRRALAGMQSEYAQAMSASARGLPDPRELEILRKAQAKNLAVGYYHYSLVLQKLGLVNDAALCRKRVLELGYQPNARLF